MANNSNLRKADKVEFDEYYTEYEYIQKEVNAYLEYNPDTFRGKTILCPCDDPEWSNFTKFFAQNFETLGLKKLISTSYAFESKMSCGAGYQFTLEDYLTDFETKSEKFDKEKASVKGKIFTLSHDANNSNSIDINDLQWDYLEGDGDFRSEEVTKLRDEADIIVTNPPFSLIRDFIAWVNEAKKQLLIIGRETIISYKEIFPLIKENKLWTGATSNSSDMVFRVPEGTAIAIKDKEKAERLGYKGSYTRLGNSCWFTNIDHGRRHQNLELMTMADNLKFSRHKTVKTDGYQKFDNYDAINIPYTDSIPKDYTEKMGVPISFLHKYNPEQFEIIDGIGRYSVLNNEETKKAGKYLSMINGEAKFFRIIIKKRGK